MGTKREMLSNAVQQTQSLTSLDEHFPGRNFRLGATLIRDEVVQVCESRERGLLTATGMVKPLHSKELPLDGVMDLIQECAGHRHLGVCTDRIPARLLLLYPVPHTLAIRCPGRGGDVIGKAGRDHGIGQFML
jgi:hypothetical protein